VLTPEEARRRLDSLRDPRWHKAALERAAKLPDAQRAIAEAILEAPPENYAFRGHGTYERFRDQKIAAGRALDALPEDKRADVMNALHPGLGAALTRWWTDARARPYQRGWSRTAFRTTARFPGLTVRERALDLTWLVDFAGPFDADPPWLAIWGGHLIASRHGRFLTAPAVGGLLAAAIDLGGPQGDESFAALLEIAGGEHPTGMMGRHVIHALLGSSRRAGWEFTSRLLLAAQRQEGLRQVILEAADEANLDAFAYILGIILDNKLLRFAAAIRAAGVWLGFGANITDLPRVEDRVRKLTAFLGSATERALALGGGDPWDAYLALCAGGMRDVMATLDEMRQLAAAPSPELRAAALRYAHASWLIPGEQVLAAALDDDDIRVAALAASLLSSSGLELPGSFEALTRLVGRLPPRSVEVPVRDAEGTSLGIEQAAVRLDLAATADRLAEALGERPVGDLLPWLPVMSATGRSRVASRIADATALTPELRAVLISLLGDRSPGVRSVALKTLEKLTITPAEAPAVEALLTRSAADIRRGALTLLASQPAAAAKASAERLAASTDNRQRDAAAELRRETGAAGAGEIEDLRVTLPGPRTEPLRPRMPRRPRDADDARADGERARGVIAAIDELAHQHRDVPVTVSSWQGTQEVLFGDAAFLPGPFARLRSRRGTGETGTARDMALGHIFRGWWADRPGALRGEDDGLDALRALVLTHLEPASVRHRPIVAHVTEWLLADHMSGAVIDECLDGFEASLAAVPDDKLIPPAEEDYHALSVTSYHSLPIGDWRVFLHANPWFSILGQISSGALELLAPEQTRRLYRLLRWLERPHPDAVRLLPDDDLLAAAHRAGAATDGDVTEMFLMPDNQLFRTLTGRWRSQAAAEHPALVPIADRVRDRLVETELWRGDLPTPTSRTVRNIGSVAGTDTTMALLARLGDTPLTRGRYSRRGEAAESRDAVFSHLLRVSFPAPGETGAELIKAAADAGIPDERLVDLALYAPQWACAVEEASGWPGLADGVLWLYAHTKDSQWTVDHELRESWAAMVAERTPLSAGDLLDGAVDVDWFWRSYGELGEARWSVLYKAARNAAGGNGHRRAQLFAEAMLGQAAETDLAGRIRDKRNQDAVRALGLLPLPDEPDAAKTATARRYALLREFERTGKAFGSQRRASEATAVRIGIENLARTAGYADPRRFIWAVEAAAAGDLADGPVSAEAGGITVTLSVTGEGTPELTVRRGDRALRGVPAAVKKDPAVVALTARKTELTKQVSRVRAALQEAMTAQEAFTAADFEALGRHPVVAPMLGRLVWVTADGVTMMRGRGAAGDLAAKAVDGPLRIAYPGDMVADGTWVAWQERLFKREIRQPFKQVFRELYVLTPAERESGPESRRFEGHQVQPRQAAALLRGRGWVTSQESSAASRAFHRHGYVARVSFAGGLLTPVEAGLPAVEGVYFTRPGEWLPQPLEVVPPIVFSETMRDVDLVVSVAHAGGVDPEATASTVEMRAALVRETARLMKLPNVSFAGSHVLIGGKLGEYSLHLGSGTVHRRPGGALCVIPVGSQHRGRLFLPFADDDPKTAEVVSKVLLLARDHEIRDPTILEQLGDNVS
jgi:uncharacterized protein DUF5724/uncharacterized protein DUF4132